MSFSQTNCISDAEREKVLLWVDTPQDGATNMAVDDALLHLVAQGKIALPVFRFYFWSEPTLSLGYFQHYSDRQSHSSSLDLPLVRRRTGGGAIIHDRELTYSAVFPASHPCAKGQRLELYQRVHQSFIRAFAQYDFHLILADQQSVETNRAQKDIFLCFERFTAGDVLWQDKEIRQKFKLIGSAQYRDRQKAVLQHGSILYASSGAAKELPGACELQPTLAESVTRVGKTSFSEELFREQLVRIIRAQLIRDFPWLWIDFKTFLDQSTRREFEQRIAFYRETRYLNRCWLHKHDPMPA